MSFAHVRGVKVNRVSNAIPRRARFRATHRHAAPRVEGRSTLSIRLNHLPPLTPLTSADTMRSVQTEASAHHSPRPSPPVASVPC